MAMLPENSASPSSFRRLPRRTMLAGASGFAVALLAACGGGATSSAETSSVRSPAVASAITESTVAAPASSSIATASVSSTARTSPTVRSAISSAASVTAAPAALRLATWLGRPTNKTVYEDQLIAPYRKLHPGVTIAMEYNMGAGGGNAQYFTQMLAETAAGDPPDMLTMNEASLQGFEEKHGLLALDPLLARSKVNLQNYVPDAPRLGRYPQASGKLWAWVPEVAVGVLFYDKTLFTNAGVPYPTADLDYQTTLLDAAQKLTKKGADEASSFWGFDPTYEQYGVLFSFGFQLVSDDGTKALVDTPASIAALLYYGDLYTKYQVAFPPTAWKTFNVQEGPFETNHVAMSIDGAYEIQAWRKLTSLDWDVAMPPKGPAGQFAELDGVPSYGISPLSKQQDTAWDFLSWWIVNQTAAQVTNPGNLPTRLAALQAWPTDQLKQDATPAHIGVLVDIAAKAGKAVPLPPHWPDVDKLIRQTLVKLRTGKVNASDGAHALAGQINAVLAQP